MKTTNFLELLQDVLQEQGKKISDLQAEGVVSKFTVYDFSTFVPSLSNAIKIANHLQVSLDYILGNATTNNFKPYKPEQKNFYHILQNTMQSMNISQAKMAHDVGFARNSFCRWKNGVQPKLSTIIEISKYLRCQIDDLLEFEV